MATVQEFIGTLRDNQLAARYEVRSGGRVLSNLVATVQGSSELTATGECVAPEVFKTLPGASVMSLGKMAQSDRNRSGKDHNICIFSPSSSEGEKGAIQTIAYGQPTPDQQYTEQVAAHEAALAQQAKDPAVIVPNVVLYAGHFIKGSALGQQWQIQYTIEDGDVLLQLMAW